MHDCISLTIYDYMNEGMTNPNRAYEVKARCNCYFDSTELSEDGEDGPSF